MLFLRLFGKSDDSNAVTDLEEEPGKNEDEESLKDLDEAEIKSIEQVKILMQEDLVKLKQEKENSFERWIFHKVFHTDVLYLCTLKTLWRGKREPQPLVLDTLLHMTDTSENSNDINTLPDQMVWSIKKNIDKFLHSAKILKEKQQDDQSPISWDKDDDLHLDFVTAASNLRSHIFNIPLSSRFDVKSKAGEVIPAIATTNAIIAGLMVLEAFKLLNQQYDKNRNTYLFQQPSANRVLMPSRLSPPNPNCYVCGSKFATVKINVEITTLKEFINEIAVKNFSIHRPYIYLGSSCLYEPKVEDDSDDEGMEYQLDKTLRELNMVDNEIIKLEDAETNYELNVSIIHQTHFKESQTFEISGELPAATQRKTITNVTEEDNDTVLISKNNNSKRKRSNDVPNVGRESFINIDE